mgnify:CR=1 FL=1
MAPPPHYDEELAAQTTIVKKAKEEIDRIHKQAQKGEAELQQKLDSMRSEFNHALPNMEAKATTTLQAANDESTTKLHDMEAKATTTLQAANGISAAKIHAIEEGYQRAYAYAIQNDQLLTIRNEHIELQQHSGRQH